MNIFDVYELPDGYVPEAPNWVFDGQRYARMDGARLTRSTTFIGWLFELGEATCRISTRDTMSPSDIDALLFANRKWPLVQPRAAVGQVLCLGYIETSVIEVRRLADGRDGVRLSSNMDSVQLWTEFAAPVAIVAGPGSPWASPDWTLQEIPTTPSPEVH